MVQVTKQEANIDALFGWALFIRQRAAFASA
jgi:hypothetical protein